MNCYVSKATSNVKEGASGSLKYSDWTVNSVDKHDILFVSKKSMDVNDAK